MPLFQLSKHEKIIYTVYIYRLLHRFSTAGLFYESDVFSLVDLVESEKYKDESKYTAVLNDYLCNQLFIIIYLIAQIKERIDFPPFILLRLTDDSCAISC